jgi:integrase/recombinase XerD
MKKLIEQCYDEFVLDCKLKNLSKETIIFYNNCYKKFYNFLKKHKKKCMHELTNDLIKQYTLFLLDDNIAEYSVNSYLRGMKIFIRYAQNKNYIKYYKINLIKQNEVVKPTFSIEELQKLVAQPTNPQYIKTWVMSMLLLSSAIRSSTLCNLHVEDFNFRESCFVLTKTKTRKIYILPLEKSVRFTIQEYIIMNNLGAGDYLFINSIGNKYTRHTLREVLLKYYKALGVEKSGVHIFRHTFGREFVVNGGDMVSLQQMLTHSSIVQSRQYVRLYSKDLEIASNKYNPLAESNLKKLKKIN